MTGHQRGGDRGGMEFCGICSLCENAPDCVFPRDPNRPLLHCDELVIPAPVPPRPAARRMTPNYTEAQQGGNPVKGSAPVLGLCRLCDGRETCTYPWPEGGVWHCEEYT